mmetsp:Transcript_9091/g.21761  ORF Transcript_9091/g.21761 Transcript_9091/m.21761 type:complete len:163 (-) Transcript_9091:48-536(-)
MARFVIAASVATANQLFLKSAEGGDEFVLAHYMDNANCQGKRVCQPLQLDQCAVQTCKGGGKTEGYKVYAKITNVKGTEYSISSCQKEGCDCGDHTHEFKVGECVREFGGGHGFSTQLIKAAKADTECVSYNVDVSLGRWDTRWPTNSSTYGDKKHTTDAEE